MGMLTAAERVSAHGPRAVIDSRELAAFASAVVAYDDQAELGALSNVPGRAAVGPGVIACGRHLPK